MVFLVYFLKVKYDILSKFSQLDLYLVLSIFIDFRISFNVKRNV